MYMILNHCSYEELKGLRKPHYRPYDSEITTIINELETYRVDLNGQKIGVYERKNIEGNIIETGTYKDDLKHGLFEYRSSDRYQTGYYSKNKKVGLWRMYRNTILVRSGYYRDNVPHGLWSFYDEMGTCIKEGTYVKGKKDGVWKDGDRKEYYLEGVLCPIDSV
jgi:antitoxin component YwqK of YwqJK toxin-antitoxin module